VIVFATRVAVACPNCPTARTVRASVFDQGFWMNMGLISLPLVLLVLITTWLYRIGLESSHTTENDSKDRQT